MANVEIRTATLDLDDREVARLSGLLDDAERARGMRFRYDRDRRRFIVRRARLRQWLGERVGDAPERLVFAIGDHGKPSLGGGPHFSLSHSGELMMLAVAEVAVGCDIERIDLELDWQPSARSLFAPGEYGALTTLPETAGRRAFFECWARKEAFVKALGQGLSYPLDAFAVSVEHEPALVDGGEGWAIGRPLAFDPNYAAAVVTRDDGRRLDIRDTGQAISAIAA